MGEASVRVDDGARLWTISQGRGRPSIWCHGGPGGTDTLGPLAAMIDDLVLVHRYEQRACGRSSGGPPHTIARAIADLEALRRAWGHATWLVGGASFGAALALAYAIAHPDRVRGLVFLAGLVRLAGQPDWYEQYRHARVARLAEPDRSRYRALQRRRQACGDTDEGLAAAARRLVLTAEFGDAAVARRLAPRLEADLAATNHVVNRELGDDVERSFLAPELRARLGAVACPVLLVHGAADPRPVAAVEALAAELPQAQLVVLPGVGHFLDWEAPEAVRDRLRAFITRLDRP